VGWRQLPGDKRAGRHTHHGAERGDHVAWSGNAILTNRVEHRPTQRRGATFSQHRRVRGDTQDRSRDGQGPESARSGGNWKISLFPKRYDEINWLVEDHLPQENRLLHRVTQHTATDLRSARIKADVAGRPKHLYAIHQQMLERLHAGGRLAVSAPASR
jgi:hypothetical protein